MEYDYNNVINKKVTSNLEYTEKLMDVCICFYQRVRWMLFDPSRSS